jgi:exodeoxyribonuclease III
MDLGEGQLLPSDHAPLVIDIDSPGHPFDADWASVDSRIAARRLRIRWGGN